MSPSPRFCLLGVINRRKSLSRSSHGLIVLIIYFTDYYSRNYHIFYTFTCLFISKCDWYWSMDFFYWLPEISYLPKWTLLLISHLSLFQELRSVKCQTAECSPGPSFCSFLDIYSFKLLHVRFRTWKRVAEVTQKAVAHLQTSQLIRMITSELPVLQ